MSLWAFRFLLYYILILLTQPQNRFTFLYNLHIADLCVMASIGLHVLSSMQDKRPIIRMGPATITAILLMVACYLSLFVAPFTSGLVWNSHVDLLMKNALVLILVEAMAISVERVWAVMATIMLGTLWWIKAGLRLGAIGATYSGGRIMGPGVSLVENPNGFAYMMCVTLPIYLYFFQQSRNKYLRWAFLGLTMAGVYCIFNTGSRTGLVALIVCGIFVFPKYAGAHRKTILVAAASIFIIFSMTDPSNVQRFRTIGTSIEAFLMGENKTEPGELTQDEQSAHERHNKNKDTVRLIRTYPLFGVGINADASEFVADFPNADGQVHNEILMAGKQMGLVGMGIYLSLLIILFRSGNRVQRLSGNWWASVSDLGWTLKVQAIVVAVGGFFSPIPWNPYNMILVGCASALWINFRQVQKLYQPSEHSAVSIPGSTVTG